MAERAEREARAAATLRHPRCQRIYALARDTSHIYIAYEYVPGRTLRHALDARELDDEGSVEAAAQVLDALAHAHRKGIVHRDVKPSNVLLAESDGIDVRLLDFGLAQMAEFDTLTAIGDVPGTLTYVSPGAAGGRDRDLRGRRLGRRRDALRRSRAAIRSARATQPTPRAGSAPARLRSSRSGPTSRRRCSRPSRARSTGTRSSARHPAGSRPSFAAGRASAAGPPARSSRSLPPRHRAPFSSTRRRSAWHRPWRRRPGPAGSPGCCRSTRPAGRSGSRSRPPRSASPSRRPRSGSRWP